jgi:Fe-S-cluster-containing dehydrogenase component
MATTIRQTCINCNVCIPACPNQAIAVGEEFVYINPDYCTECVGEYGFENCAEVCPVDDCCVPDMLHRENEEQLLARYNVLHGTSLAISDLNESNSRFRNPNPPKSRTGSYESDELPPIFGDSNG